MSAAEATDAPVPALAADGLQIVSITPEPTEAERAAITAAVEALHSDLWPRLSAVVTPSPSPRWRYAGRPWLRRQTYGGWS